MLQTKGVPQTMLITALNFETVHIPPTGVVFKEGVSNLPSPL